MGDVGKKERVRLYCIKAVCVRVCARVCICVCVSFMKMNDALVQV